MNWFRYRCVISALFVALASVPLANSPAAPAPGGEPWRSAVQPGEDVLDTWTEGAGYGSNRVVIRRVKLENRITGQKRLLRYDEMRGVALAEAGERALRAASFPSLMDPELIARFERAAPMAAGEEPLETVIVWFRVPKAREHAILALWDRDAEPAESSPQEDADREPDVAAQRLAAVTLAEADQRSRRAEIAARYVAEGAAFAKLAGIPESRIVHRYHFAPAVIARLTLSECRRLEASGHVNFMFPDRTASPELDIIHPATRGFEGQEARYNGAGVTIAHIEPGGRIQGANPWLNVTASYLPAGAVNEHGTAIGGIIRSTHRMYRGMSRGCNLLSVNPSGDSQALIDPSVDWALGQGATIINLSYKLKDSADGTLDWSDIYFDYMVHNARVFFTKSAGNEGNGTGVVTSPGRGYNSLAVGNVQDNGTTAWGNDTMRSSSSYVDPETGGDKPEVSAYGYAVITTTTTDPWIGDQGSGTSYAAPLVAAIGGLCVDKDASLSDEPGGLKAIMMAAALAHNIEGAVKMSDKDGAGKVVATATKVPSVRVTISDASFDASEEYLIWNLTLVGGQTNRIVLAYTHEPTSESATPDPSSYDKCDLDLRLYVGGGLVASSAYGTRNAFEIIDYKPAVTTSAQVRIRNFYWDPDVSSLRIGVAAVAANKLGSGPEPSDDPYEENDTRATAADPKGNGGNWEQTWLKDIDGLGIKKDEDWYKIFVTPNFNLVNVDCRFFDSEGDIDISLVDGAGATLASSASITDNEYISHTVAATGGTYYIRVFYNSYSNSYDLWWDDVEPGPPSPATVSVVPGIGCGVADLSWSAVDGVQGYWLYYDEDASNPPYLPVDNGTPLNGSYLGNVTSIIVSNLAPTTTYYYAIVATNSGGTSGYAQVSGRTGACEDNYEENDTRASAFYPSFGNWENIWLSSISNRGVQYDSDYYRMYVSSGFERLIITCSFVHAEGNVNLYLVNSNGTIIASSTGFGNTEVIDYTVGQGSTYYYILVAGDNSGNLYDLKWDDALRIVPLPPATVAGTVGPGCGRVSLSWSAASGATGYKVYYDEDSGNPPFTPSDNGTPVSGTDVGNVTSVAISNLNPATYYYFAVRAYDADGDSDYSVQRRVRTGACEDAYEENDTLLAAVLPGGGDWRNRWLSSIAGKGVQYDFDFYLVNVTSGYERVLARCIFEHDEGNLWLNLYNSNGALVVSSGTTNDIESIDVVVPSAGTYYLRVDGSPVLGNVYDLWWNDAPRIQPPSLVHAAPGTNCGEVRVTWTPVAGATGYRLSFDEDTANPPYSPTYNGTPASGSAVGNVTNVLVTKLNGGQSYFFAVQAMDALGDSDYSDEALATAGICELILETMVYETGTGQVVLRWVSDYGYTYLIQRSMGQPSNYVNYVSGIRATPPTNIYSIISGPSNTMFYRVQQE